MEKLNFDGIQDVHLENLKANKIAEGITQYILWEGETKHTAIYQFEENTKLPFIDSHDISDEHIYVLDGVFNDGLKDYKKGSYIINPKGTVHHPQSTSGCVVLVTFP